MVLESEKSLPTPVESGTWDGIALEDDYLVFSYTINDDPSTGNSLQNLMGTEDYQRAFLKYLFSSSKEASVSQLIDMVNDADCGMKCVYSSKLTGEKVSITLSSKDMKAWNYFDIKNVAKDYVTYLINQSNASLPVSLDEVTILNKISMDASFVTYEYQIVEQGFTVTELLNNREAFINDMMSGDEDTYFEEICKDAGLNIMHKYTGITSSDVISFSYTPVEHNRLD